MARLYVFTRVCARARARIFYACVTAARRSSIADLGFLLGTSVVLLIAAATAIAVRNLDPATLPSTRRHGVTTETII